MALRQGEPAVGAKSYSQVAAIVFAILAFSALSTNAAAQAVNLGGITLTLPPPAGQCQLDQSVDADADLLEGINEGLGRTANKLLSASAECAELTDWRQGRRPRLANMAQYHITRSLERTWVSASEIKSICATVRAQSVQATGSIATKSQTTLEAVIEDVKVNEVRLLGVFAEDATSCYSGQFQRATVGNFTIEQVVIQAITVVKARLVFYYLSAPFAAEKTVNQQVNDLLAQHQSNLAALHAVNKYLGQAQSR
jgi:hypothetical protein